MKVWLGILLAVIVIVVLIFFIGEKKNAKEAAKKDRKPIVFVHGFRGQARSMDTMIERFEQKKWGRREGTCRVDAHGKVTCEKPITLTGNGAPMIQVIFENNTASIKDQGLWMKEVLKKVKATYGNDHVNVIAHSMGGLAMMNYLMNYEGEKGTPKVDRMVTMGSPMKGIEMSRLIEQYPKAAEKKYSEAAVDLQTGSPALEHMYKDPSVFNKISTKMLAIAGNVVDEKPKEPGSPLNDHLGDGTVSVASAWYLKKYIPNLELKWFAVNHFNLHESPAVDAAAYQFLTDKK
ncbi:alpha/beta fold hydrolase [Priestia koreensis]|uniref:alpha/beta fold hydrolase n=1 Tax=Priestia koreensis TaxID=284581 RepID=UPI00203C6360|nr:alpha/beta fold hydrolase [Priestia koreensis]